MRGTVHGKLLILTGAVLALAASLLSSLPPALAGFTAAVLFVLAVPVLDGLHKRLQSLPALFAAACLILLALNGIVT